MPGSQGSGPGLVGAGSGRRQSSTAAMSAAVCSSRPAGRCEQVEEWVLTLAGEVGHDLVGPGVERLNDLGANQLLGRYMKAVGVALNQRVH